MLESRYDFLCALLLGLGQLSMFTGYDTQLTIVEPIMHSVNERSPATIDAHAGYYGMATVCVIYMLANLVAPWALGILGSKKALLLGSMLFTLHISTFLFIHWCPYYATCALLGFGFALFYTGHGGYTTEHSTKTTIARNSSLSWALATSCMVVGGVVLLLTTKTDPENIECCNNQTNVVGRSYRLYSDDDIRLTYGAFLIVSIVSNVIFALLPSREVENSIATKKESKNHIGFVEQIRRTIDTMREKSMLQLIPLCSYVGMYQFIWVSIYPTALIFTKKLASHVYLPAYYSIVFGLSDMLAGFTIGAVSRKYHNFSRIPTLTIGCISFSVAMLLVLLSTPTWATAMPTDEETILIEPNIYISLLIAVLFGIGDNCVNTSRTVVCTLILTDKRSQVFAISKFHQSLMGAIIMFMSPLISVHVYFALMLAYGSATVILYRQVINNLDVEGNTKIVNEKPALETFD